MRSNTIIYKVEFSRGLEMWPEVGKSDGFWIKKLLSFTLKQVKILTKNHFFVKTSNFRSCDCSFNKTHNYKSKGKQIGLNL